MNPKPKASPDTRDLLRLPEAAQRLGVSTRTLRVLRAAGRVPVIQVSPHRIAFDPVDLDRYIAQQRR